MSYTFTREQIKESIEDLTEKSEYAPIEEAVDYDYVLSLLAEVAQLREAIRFMRCEECGNQFGDNYFVGGTLCSECVGESDE